MSGPVIPNPIPAWLRPENASVLDTPVEKAIKALARLLGADDPQSQVMGLMNPTEAIGGTSPVMQAIDALAKKVKGIRAFHGSPHDFDQFSMEKIGTGEGAQAYGHGLYFAENEDVARSYRDSLAQQVNVGGRPILQNNQRLGTTGDAYLDDMLVANHGDIDAVIRDLQQDVAANYPNPVDRQKAAAQLAKAQNWKASGAVQATNNGRMYEVQINADPDDFLDWDAPLSAKHSQAAVGSLGDVRPVKLANGYFGVTRIGPDGSGKIIQGINEATPEAAMATLNRSFDQIKGKDAYTVLSGITGDKAAVSEGLKKQGVPGIKYFDAMSRGSKEGSRNMVVFDDKLISIVKKYGILGALSAGLINEAQARQLSAQGYGN